MNEERIHGLWQEFKDKVAPIKYNQDKVKADWFTIFTGQDNFVDYYRSDVLSLDNGWNNPVSVDQVFVEEFNLEYDGLEIIFQREVEPKISFLAVPINQNNKYAMIPDAGFMFMVHDETLSPLVYFLLKR